MEFPAKPGDKTGWPWECSNSRSSADRGDALLPRISIVTPSFNQAQFLEETIRSVLLQGYPNLEYIVIDGCSTDGSIEIIKKYEPWLAYWASEPDKGQAHAINKGFARATGEIMGYLNSDDMLAQDALWRVIDLLSAQKRNREFVLTFAGMVFNESGAIKVELPRLHQILTSWLESADSLFQPSTFWSSFVYHRIGGFDERMKFCFDKDFFIRAIFGFRSCHYIAMPEFIASWFRLHESSKTSKLASVRDDENRIIHDRYQSKKPYASILKKETKRRQHDAEILHALSSNKCLTAAFHLIRALILAPEKAISRFYLGAWRRVIGRILARSID